MAQVLEYQHGKQEEFLLLWRRRNNLFFVLFQL